MCSAHPKLSQSHLSHNPSPLPPGKYILQFPPVLPSPIGQTFRRRPGAASHLRSTPFSELRSRGQGRTGGFLWVVLRIDAPCTTPHSECIQDLRARTSAAPPDFPHQKSEPDCLYLPRMVPRWNGILPWSPYARNWFPLLPSADNNILRYGKCGDLLYSLVRFPGKLFSPLLPGIPSQSHTPVPEFP